MHSYTIVINLEGKKKIWGEKSLIGMEIQLGQGQESQSHQSDSSRYLHREYHSLEVCRMKGGGVDAPREDLNPQIGQGGKGRTRLSEAVLTYFCPGHLIECGESYITLQTSGDKV
jgi:hypothetical protein